MHRHLPHRVRRQLVRGVKRRPLCALESYAPAGEAEDGVARGLGEGNVGVVFCGFDVDVVGFVDWSAGAGAGGGFGIGGGQELL